MEWTPKKCLGLNPLADSSEGRGGCWEKWRMLNLTQVPTPRTRWKEVLGEPSKQAQVALQNSLHLHTGPQRETACPSTDGLRSRDAWQEQDSSSPRKIPVCLSTQVNGCHEQQRKQTVPPPVGEWGQSPHHSWVRTKLPFFSIFPVLTAEAERWGSWKGWERTTSNPFWPRLLVPQAWLGWRAKEEENLMRWEWKNKWTKI